MSIPRALTRRVRSVLGRSGTAAKKAAQGFAVWWATHRSGPHVSLAASSAQVASSEEEVVIPTDRAWRRAQIYWLRNAISVCCCDLGYRKTCERRIAGAGAWHMKNRDRFGRGSCTEVIFGQRTLAGVHVDTGSSAA